MAVPQFNLGRILDISYSRTPRGWDSFDQYPRQLKDVNGDGLADIVGFGLDGVYVSLSEGGGTFAKAKAALDYFAINKGGWNTFNQYPRLLGDINGDGKADIVGFGYNATYVALGRSNGTFQAAKIGIGGGLYNPANGWESFDQYPRQLGDVNGDGKSDIIGFGNNATYVSLGKSDGTFQAAKIGIGGGLYNPVNGWNSFDQYPRLVGDVNGDHKADIVGFGNNATYVSLGKSDGTFEIAKIGLGGGLYNPVNGWSSFDKYPRQLGDINGDGMADIVGFGLDGVYVSFGQTNGTFADTQTITNSFSTNDGWTSHNLSPRLVGDITGDSRAEIVGFSDNNIWVGRQSSYAFKEGKSTVYGTNFANDYINFAPAYLNITGSMTVFGQNGNDTIYASGGDDVIYGGNGNDIIDGGNGKDTIYAGPGKDSIYSITDGNDTISAGEGDDRLQLLARNATGVSSLSGDDGNDYIYSAANNARDSLTGGNGSDVLVSSFGGANQLGDILTGGTGRDVFWVRNPPDVVAPSPDADYLNYVSAALSVLGLSGNSVISVASVVTSIVQQFKSPPRESPKPITGASSQSVNITDFTTDDILVLPNNFNSYNLRLPSTTVTTPINGVAHTGIPIDLIINGSTTQIAFVDMPAFTNIAWESQAWGQSNTAWYITSAR